jgi:hypothetical protein
MELPPLTSDEEAELLRELQHWTTHVQNMQRAERNGMARLATCPPEERQREAEDLAFTRRILRLAMEHRHRKAQRLGIGDCFLPTLQN